MGKPTIDTQSKKIIVDTEAYSKMIDALITLRESAMWGEISQECRNKTLAALKKAGIEF